MNKETTVGICALISFITFMGILPTFFYSNISSIMVNTITSISLGLTIAFVVWWFIILESKVKR